MQAQQFEGESKTDESAISISRSLPNRNTSVGTNKKTFQECDEIYHHKDDLVSHITKKSN